MAWRIAARWTGSGRFALGMTALVLAAPPVASSSDFASELRVFQQDYDGEAVFPTTPELDEIMAGGLQGASESGRGPGPVLDGSTAHANVSAIGFEAEVFSTSFTIDTQADEVDLVPGDGACQTMSGFCSGGQSAVSTQQVAT